jgi:hypothetical protein
MKFRIHLSDQGAQALKGSKAGVLGSATALAGHLSLLTMKQSIQATDWRHFKTLDVDAANESPAALAKAAGFSRAKSARFIERIERLN